MHYEKYRSYNKIISITPNNLVTLLTLLEKPEFCQNSGTCSTKQVQDRPKQG